MAANRKNQEAENILEREINNIEKKFFREFQRKMYECSAACCSNKTSSADELASCLKDCSAEHDKAHKYFTSELNSLQGGLHMCVKACNEEAKYKMGPKPTDAEVAKATVAFENCAIGCIDKYMEYLPKFFKKINEVLGSKKY